MPVCASPEPRPTFSILLALNDCIHGYRQWFSRFETISAFLGEGDWTGVLFSDGPSRGTANGLFSEVEHGTLSGLAAPLMKKNFEFDRRMRYTSETRARPLLLLYPRAETARSPQGREWPSYGRPVPRRTSSARMK